MYSSKIPYRHHLPKHWQTKICETTEGVKSYSGYVHLPPGALEDLGEDQNYPINTFFWFFESRNDPQNAPLSIWMNGGKCSKCSGFILNATCCYLYII